MKLQSNYTSMDLGAKFAAYTCLSLCCPTSQRPDMGGFSARTGLKRVGLPVLFGFQGDKAGVDGRGGGRGRETRKLLQQEPAVADATVLIARGDYIWNDQALIGDHASD